MVPKRIPDENGTLGAANALKVVSLEEKLGLHGSPTAVMAFEGATGWMVGEPNAGMRTMFTMMNNARLGVSIQGVGQAEAAYQKALSYTLERKQGRSIVEGGTGTIFDHADVRRMLATMRADTYAARAIALSCAVAIDMGNATGDADWNARAEFLTPIAKVFGTEVGGEVARMGVQVHGGMGVIEETGAAQFSRDVRVTAIYEGTNGIQAMDFVGRKLSDGGEVAYQLLTEIETDAERSRSDEPDLANKVWEAAEALRDTTEWLVERSDLNERFAGSVPYLRAFARVLGAHYHLKSSIAEGGEGARTRLARFYIRRILPEHAALLAHVREGAEDLMALTAEDLAV
jgi:hypothetical protein